MQYVQQQQNYNNDTSNNNNRNNENNSNNKEHLRVYRQGINTSFIAKHQDRSQNTKQK